MRHCSFKRDVLSGGLELEYFPPHHGLRDDPLVDFLPHLADQALVCHFSDGADVKIPEDLGLEPPVDERLDQCDFLHLFSFFGPTCRVVGQQVAKMQRKNRSLTLQLSGYNQG